MLLIQSTSNESNSPWWNGLHPMFLSNFTYKGFLYFSFLNKFLHEDILLYVLITLNNQSTSNESNSASWNGLHPVFSSNFTNISFLYLSFLKQFVSEEMCPDHLNNQSTSNESNSACWNGLHPVFLSNLLTKVSGFLNNQADFINMHSAICPNDTLKVWSGLVHSPGRS